MVQALVQQRLSVNQFAAEQKKTVTQIFGEEQIAWEGRCKDLMKYISDLQAEVEKWTFNATLEQSKAIANFESYCKLRAQLPKRGKWINSKERMRPDMCSVCGCVYEADRFMDKIAWNYCPNCGSLMVGENDERN